MKNPKLAQRNSAIATVPRASHERPTSVPRLLTGTRSRWLLALAVSGLVGAIALHHIATAPTRSALNEVSALVADRPTVQPTTQERSDKPYLLRHPEVARLVALRAFLLTIAQGEGTYPNSAGINPYRVIFSYAEYKGDWSHHPAECLPIAGTNLCSDAAGLYQFLSTSWAGTRDWFTSNGGKLVTVDRAGNPVGEFAPINQDLLAAAYLVRLGAHQALMAGVSVTPDRGLVAVDKAAFTAAAHKAAGSWASFPLEDGTGIGSSAELGSQSNHSIDQVWGWFLVHLEAQQSFIPGAVAALAELAPSPTREGAANLMSAPKLDQAIGKDAWISDLIRWRDRSPAEGGRSSGYWHKGIDVATAVGTPMYAPTDGSLECMNGGGSGGLEGLFTLTARHDRQFLLSHLSECNSGDYLAGEVMALSGNTGASTGPHLHLEGWMFDGGEWNFYVYAIAWIFKVFGLEG